MDNKITLFTSSSISMSLISYLLSKEILACVALTRRTDADANNLLYTLRQHNIPHFVFNDEDDNANIEILKQIKSDTAIVFSFPHKITNSVMEYFDNYIFNIHASALPTFRGKQPVFWQLKNGENKSALTLSKMVDKLDAGNIVLQKEFSIDPKDTHGILNGYISQAVVPLVEEFLELSKKHKKDIPASAQIGDSSKAPSVEQKDIKIEFKTMHSQEISNLARACNPIYGGAQTIWKNSIVSILEATPVDMPNLGLEAGTILHIGHPDGFIVSTKDAALRIDIVSVPEGIFSGLRFAKRFSIDAGDKLS